MFLISQKIKEITFQPLKMLLLLLLSFSVSSCAMQTFTKTEQEAVLQKEKAIVVFKSIASIGTPIFPLETTWKNKNYNHNINNSHYDNWYWDGKNNITGINTPFHIYLVPAGSYELIDLVYSETKYSLLNDHQLYKTHVILPDKITFEVEAGEIVYLGDLMLLVEKRKDLMNLMTFSDTHEEKRYDSIYILDDYQNAERMIYERFELLTKLPVKKRLLSSKSIKYISSMDEYRTLITNNTK